MNGPEKSDSPIVAVKPANEAARAAEEQVEPRGGIKENADQQTTARTQSREAVSHAQARIRGAVTRNRTQPLTTLLHHVSVEVLRAGFFGLKKNAAPGVDGLTWTQYEEDLEANLHGLHARVHGGGCIGRWPPVDGIFRRRMGGVDRWALPRWRTRLSRRRWRRS